MAYSPLACKFIQANSNNYTPNRSAWGQDRITEICIHYMCGNCSIETLGDIWQNPTRYGSSTYGIGSDGRIACYVDENDIAWCNSNWDSNVRSASIETANLSPSDPTVTDYALNSLIRLVADIAKRNGMGTLVKGKNVTWHSMYTSTSCPGSYLLSKMDYIVEQANKINNSEPTDLPIDADQVLTVGSKVAFNGIFKVDELIQPNSKYPNGALGCYKTCYGKPCGENDYIPCDFIGAFEKGKERANYDAILKTNGNWVTDRVFNVVGVELPTKYTPNGVATLEYNGIKFRVDCEPLYELED